MLQGLSQLISRWRRSPNSHHCTDESHKSFQAKAASACLMRRLVALTCIRVQLMQQQPVLDATLSLVQALCLKFTQQMHAGLFTFELRPLLHQVRRHPHHDHQLWQGHTRKVTSHFRSRYAPRRYQHMTKPWICWMPYYIEPGGNKQMFLHAIHYSPAAQWHAVPCVMHPDFQTMPLKGALVQTCISFNMKGATSRVQ